MEPLLKIFRISQLERDFHVLEEDAYAYTWEEFRAFEERLAELKEYFSQEKPFSYSFVYPEGYFPIEDENQYKIFVTVENFFDWEEIQRHIFGLIIESFYPNYKNKGFIKIIGTVYVWCYPEERESNEELPPCRTQFFRKDENEGRPFPSVHSIDPFFGLPFRHRDKNNLFFWLPFTHKGGSNFLYKDETNLFIDRLKNPDFRDSNYVYEEPIRMMYVPDFQFLKNSKEFSLLRKMYENSIFRWRCLIIDWNSFLLANHI